MEKLSGGMPVPVSLTSVHSSFTVTDWAAVEPILTQFVELTRKPRRARWDTGRLPPEAHKWSVIYFRRWDARAPGRRARTPRRRVLASGLGQPPA